jgi:cytidylate kinase
LLYKVVAIDGPAGAGKSTIAKLLADRIHYTYVDSGAMYRALTLAVLDSGVDLQDKSRIIEISNNVDIDFKDKSIYLNSRLVDKQIREERINKSVSFVSAIPEVRKNIVNLQRKISMGKNVVMDGRDVGTVIFPEAFIKFFITASLEERAARRCIELEGSGYAVDLHDIKCQIEKRDYIDSNREISPLKMAQDAILIDTSGKSIDEVLDDVLEYIRLRGGYTDVL